MAGRKAKLTPVESENMHVNERSAFDGNFEMVAHDIASTIFGAGSDKTGDTAQQQLAKVLRDMLAEHPHLANVRDTVDTHRSAGGYPLHTAAGYANVHALRELIAAGADLNATKNNGVTPLCTCIYSYGQGARGNMMAGPHISNEEWERRCRQCFDMLLDAGADASACHSNVPGAHGFDALFTCTAHDYSRDDVCLPLLQALLARGARLNSVHKLRLVDGVWGDSNYATACHWAVHHLHLRCLEALLLAGSDATSLVAQYAWGARTAYQRAEMDLKGPASKAALAVFGCVAAAMQSNAVDRLALARCPQPEAFHRLGAETCRRARLTESLGSSSGPTRAQREHAVSVEDAAEHLLRAGLFKAARVSYLDALQFGAALTAHERLRVGVNLVACEQMCCRQADDWFHVKDVALKLTRDFPDRSQAWLTLGQTLSRMEDTFQMEKGYANKAARSSHAATQDAMRECLERASSAPDAEEHADDIAKLYGHAAKCGVEESNPREVKANDTFSKACRTLKRDDCTPQEMALACDLITQASVDFAACGRKGFGARQTHGSNLIELAALLMRPIGGCDDLRPFATLPVHHRCELTLVDLLSALARRTPTTAISWVAAAASVSRSWRAAAIAYLHSRAFQELYSILRELDGEQERPALALNVKYNVACTLAAMGRFDEMLIGARLVWRDRLSMETHVLTCTLDGGAHSEWATWATNLCNATVMGGQLLGMARGSPLSGTADDAAVAAVQEQVRQGMAEAILTDAEARRTRGERPMLLSNLLMTARQLCPACEPPITLLRAISGWAGTRGEDLSTRELDDLWSSLLTAARSRRQDASTSELASTFLPRGLADGTTMGVPRAVQPRSRKQKNKKKKSGGKSRSAGGSSARHADDEGEGEEAEGEEGQEAPANLEEHADPLSTAPPPAPIEAQNECPICVDTMRDVPAVMPCAGRHTACYGCIREWRTTCVLNTVEFSCPMCRESLEGWEP